MRQISTTMQRMIFIAPFSLTAIVIMFVLLAVYNYWLGNEISASGEARKLLLPMTQGYFIGLYFGIGFYRLSQLYLWRINAHYRRTLSVSYGLIIGVSVLLITLTSFLPLSLLLWIFVLTLAAALIGSQLLLARTLVEKFASQITLAIAIVMFKLALGEVVISLFLLAASLGFRVRTFHRSLREPGDISANSAVLDKVGSLQPCNSKLKVQHWFVQHLGQGIKWQQANLGWALNLPLNRLGVMPVALFLIVLVMTLTSSKTQVSEFLILVYLGIMSIALPMEANNSLHKLRTIAHLFGGKNKTHLKTQIQRKVEKDVLFNCLLFAGLIAVASYFLAWEINPESTLRSGVLIVAVNWSLYPFILGKPIPSVRWTHFAVAAGYMSFMFLVPWVIHNYLFSEQINFYFGGFIALIALFRRLSQSFFMRRSLEDALIPRPGVEAL